MPRVAKLTWVARQIREATDRGSLSLDGGLLQALRAEIADELNQNNPQVQKGGGKPGDFTLEWDGPKSQDIVLKRSCGAVGEELAVSALLGPVRCVGERIVKGHVFMKVCVRKMGLDAVLQFDCKVREKGERSDFSVHNVSYILSPASPLVSVCRRPLRCNPEDGLQGAIKEYLVARGVTVELTDYLMFRLLEKDQDQYVNCLHKMASMFTEDT